MGTYNFKKMDLIPSISWVFLGIFVVSESYELGIGSLNDPGSGLMPFLLGSLLILCSLAILVYDLRAAKYGSKIDSGAWSEIDLWKIGVIVGALFIYGMLLEKVGFSTTSFFLLLVLFKFAGLRKTGKIFAAAIATVLASYVLFIVILNVYVPSFPWKLIRTFFQSLK